MEGYMDVIAAHQRGITNVVASLGTALTQDQVRLLTRYTYRTLLCYDSDAAGEAATMRGLDILDAQGCQVGVIRVPQGKDPDEFLKNQGAEAFLALAEKAFPCLRINSTKIWKNLIAKLPQARWRLSRPPCGFGEGKKPGSPSGIYHHDGRPA